LQESLIERQIPSYHIDSADRILADYRLEHKPLGMDLTIADRWLPEGPIVVGITSGASTPDKVVEEVIEKIFAAKG
jgi:4-hydroxy-3-methylbut-2-en-1-yl diphosphate reductase